MMLAHPRNSLCGKRLASFLTACLALAISPLAGVPGMAAEPNTATVAAKAERHIESELRSSATLEFVDTPLQDVVDFLKDQHKIEIQIDQHALEEVSLGTDTPITRNLKNVSLGAALNHILRPIGLTYVVADEALLITNPVAARRFVDARVYHVRDLSSREDTIALAAAMRSALGARESRHDASSPVALSPPTYAAPADAATPKQNAAPEPDVISIDPIGTALIVRASYHGHKSVEKLLAELRGPYGLAAPAQASAPTTVLAPSPASAQAPASAPTTKPAPAVAEPAAVTTPAAKK